MISGDLVTRVKELKSRDHEKKVSCIRPRGRNEGKFLQHNRSSCVPKALVIRRYFSFRQYKMGSLISTSPGPAEVIF